MEVKSFFFFSSRGRHTRLQGDWSSDVCSSDLADCAGPADLHQYGQDRNHGIAGLQRRQAAIRPRAPDDSRAEHAVSAFSLTPKRPDAYATSLEHLRQFHGLAQCVEYGEGSGRL